MRCKWNEIRKVMDLIMATQTTMLSFLSALAVANLVDSRHKKYSVSHSHGRRNSSLEQTCQWNSNRDKILFQLLKHGLLLDVEYADLWNHALIVLAYNPHISYHRTRLFLVYKDGWHTCRNLWIDLGCCSSEMLSAADCSVDACKCCTGISRRLWTIELIGLPALIRRQSVYIDTDVCWRGSWQQSLHHNHGLDHRRGSCWQCVQQILAKKVVQYKSILPSWSPVSLKQLLYVTILNYTTLFSTSSRWAASDLTYRDR